MEKMFVYPETLDSVATSEILENVQNNSRADIASHRCKLYRTLLEQRNASRQGSLARINHERAAHGVHA